MFHLLLSYLTFLLNDSDTGVGCGLNARLSDLSARHEDMQARVAAIQERTVSQQQRMAEVYRSAIITRAKVNIVYFFFFVCVADSQILLCKSYC